ncbi:MAG: 4Fe-4S dicluster domain-containing protein [Desulfurococcaceae archaeon]|nr:4Fe-4S dicluster domain-containing protein [Desulfurococcaceae archaeon]
MAYKVLVFDSSKCTGCELCVLACNYVKTGVFGTRDARIRVFSWRDTGDFIVLGCYHCDPAPCMEACGVDAIYRDPKTGAVKINTDKCINCKACVYACPYGAITIGSNGKVIKCDLCDGDPACVKACPYGALRFEEVSKVGVDFALQYAQTLKTKTDISKRTWSGLRPV